MHRYRITWENHFTNAWGILIFAVIYGLMPQYLIYEFGPEDTVIYFFLGLCGFLVFFIPQFILHLKYYSLNRGRALYYFPSEQRLVLEINQVKYGFTYGDIENIERSKSIPLAEERVLWFPWDTYNYSIIQLKNGQRFIVTSLLVPNMYLPLEPEKIRLRKRVYCYPFGVKEVLDERREPIFNA